MGETTRERANRRRANVAKAKRTGAANNGRSDSGGNKPSGKPGDGTLDEHGEQGERIIRTDDALGDNSSGSSRIDAGAGIPSGTGTGAGTGAGARAGADSRPRRISTARRGKGSKKASLVLIEDDEADICNIVLGIGASLATATGFEGFNVADVEAQNFARPAARILHRHDGWAETVRTVADPIALLAAGGAIVIPRLIGFQLWKASQPPPTLRVVQGGAQPEQTRQEQNPNLKPDADILASVNNGRAE